jgi:hypothetical protein
MYQRFGKKGVKEGSRRDEVGRSKEGIKDGYGHFFREEALDSVA